MLAPVLSRWLAGHGVHYAWIVVAVTFLTMLTMAGAVGLPGALILPLGSEFGWSTAEISSALALRLVLFGLMGPFSAELIDRYGMRNTILTAVALVAGGLLLALAMTQLWQLVLLWGVVVGFGTGLTALVLGAIVAGRWFTAQRGLVVGLLTASSATGQLVFVPFAAWIVEHVSWRMAVMPGVVMCLVVAVLVLLFLQDRPADLGLRAFGQTEPAPPAAPAAPAAAGSPIVAAFAVLRLAARSGTFWILFGTFFICGLSTNGLDQTHFIPFCGDYGLSGTQAATVLAVMGAFDICGTVASGWLSDRYDNRWLLFWYYGLRGLSLLYLPMSSFSFYGLSLFAVFYGLDWIATVPPTVRLTANIFGRDKAGIVFGWIFAGHQLGAATAAYGAGLSRSLILSYLPAFYVAGAACLIAAVAVLAVSRPARPAPATRRPSPAAA